MESTAPHSSDKQLYFVCIVLHSGCVCASLRGGKGCGCVSMRGGNGCGCECVTMSERKREREREGGEEEDKCEDKKAELSILNKIIHML